MTERRPSLIATVLDADDVRGVAGFWHEFLGLPYRPGQGPDDGTFVVLDDAAGNPALVVQEVAELPRVTWPEGPVPAQLHLDLAVADRADLAAQVERGTALGASVLDDRSDDEAEALVVMADPAGHPFCLIAPPNS